MDGSDIQVLGLVCASLHSCTRPLTTALADNKRLVKALRHHLPRRYLPCAFTTSHELHRWRLTVSIQVWNGFHDLLREEQQALLLIDNTAPPLAQYDLLGMLQAVISSDTPLQTYKATPELIYATWWPPLCGWLRMYRGMYARRRHLDGAVLSFSDLVHALLDDRYGFAFITNFVVVLENLFPALSS